MNSEFIDPERLAAFLDGRLRPEEHAEVLRQIAASADALEILASAAQPRTNPFHPTNTAKRTTFVGRRKELERLTLLLRQTQSGNATNVMVTGEPGSGKSSLLFRLKALAEGRENAHGFRFLVVYTHIDPETTQAGLLAKIVAGLERGLANSEKMRTFLKELLAFASRIEAAGISLRDAQPAVDEAQMERFADHLARTVELITEGGRGLLRAQHDGVLLIIDEADKASPELRLGAFLKRLIEGLSWRECEHFIVSVAGLPGLQDLLRGGHNSAMRLFEVIEIQRMDMAESAAIVVEGLERASREGEPIKILPGALGKLVRMADGLPHFIQQLAYSAFAINADDVIDEEDVEEGAYGPEGAVLALGSHYGWIAYRTDRDAWALLKALATASSPGVSVAEIAESARIPGPRLRKVVERMVKDRLVVQARHEEFVAFASHALRTWVRLESDRPVE
jgi:type II secretory pathway predicted ATPase ExeA